MKSKILASIVAITMVAAFGLGFFPGQQASADDNVQQCNVVTVPVQGGTQVASYLVSPTFTGQCYVTAGDIVSHNFCSVQGGIGKAGHCIAVRHGYHRSGYGFGSMPAEEWFPLAGHTLASGQFLDLVDTTPFITTMGHMAAVIPCDSSGDPQVVVVQGIVDAGVATLEPVTPEYLQHLSDPADGTCVYHFNIGGHDATNPDGVTDLALINTGKSTVTFGPRDTLTFSAATGYMNTAG